MNFQTLEHNWVFERTLNREKQNIHSPFRLELNKRMSVSLNMNDRFSASYLLSFDFTYTAHWRFWETCKLYHAPSHCYCCHTSILCIYIPILPTWTYCLSKQYKSFLTLKMKQFDFCLKGAHFAPKCPPLPNPLTTPMIFFQKYKFLEYFWITRI